MTFCLCTYQDILVSSRHSEHGLGRAVAFCDRHRILPVVCEHWTEHVPHNRHSEDTIIIANAISSSYPQL